MLRCQGFEVKNYDFTHGRLAYESLRLVQDPSIKIPVPKLIFDKVFVLALIGLNFFWEFIAA